jgi:3-hydroxy-9,10-secoandrosta-1,3,5(10)-triene-9,17-dione monooxygenase
LPPQQSTTFSRRGFTELLVPARYGGRQAAFPAILDPVRRMAHGCASSAWTIGFYALHNWMLALFDELAQEGGPLRRLRSSRPLRWRRRAGASRRAAASG